MIGNKQVFNESNEINLPNRNPIIQLRGIVKSYKTAAGEFVALKGIDLDIAAGEFVGILGKSGAGKTTLINILTGVDHLTAGEVWIAGTPVHKLNENQVANWRGRTVGVVFQSFQLMPTLSVVNNILLPMDLCGQFRNGRSYSRAMELLQQVEISEHARKLPALISGGQQQRVAIARALANDPPIIVADEPTGRLDSSTADTIMQLFENLAAQGKTILMVSHDMSLAHRFSRVVWLADGEITSEPQLAPA